MAAGRTGLRHNTASPPRRREYHGYHAVVTLLRGNIRRYGRRQCRYRQATNVHARLRNAMNASSRIISSRINIASHRHYAVIE